MKIQVCVHHPLNPKRSKKCIELSGHPSGWVGDIELPFTEDLSWDEWAFSVMTLGSYTLYEGEDAQVPAT